MLYLHLDHELNTPFLQAVQPRTAEELTTALQRTKDHVKTGTFVIEKVSSTVQCPSFYGVLNEEECIEFKQVEVIMTDDLAFELLLTTRAKFVENLKTILLSDIDSRKSIAEEIIAAFDAGFNFTDPNFADAVKTYNAKKKELGEFSETVMQSIGHEVNIESFFQQVKNRELIVDNSNELSKKYEQLKIERAAAYERAVGVCITDGCYIAYLEFIANTTHKIGCSSMRLYAHNNNIPLNFWFNDEFFFRLQHQRKQSTTKMKAIHMLVSSDLNNFSLLVESNELTKNVSPNSNAPSHYTLRLGRRRQHLEEANKYKHNALHRAVRSLAAAEIVPYLLYELNFKDVINEKDMFGKTALLRSIKYFGEKHEEFLKANYNSEKLLDLALTCFSFLLEAEAAINIADTSGETALTRANHYKNSFISPNHPSFSLEYWLTMKSMPLNQSNNTQPLTPSNQISNLVNLQLSPIVTMPSVAMPSATIPVTINPATFFQGNSAYQQTQNNNSNNVRPVKRPSSTQSSRATKKTSTQQRGDHGADSPSPSNTKK